MADVVYRGPFAFAQTLGLGPSAYAEQLVGMEERCAAQSRWALAAVSEAMGLDLENGSDAIAKLRVHFGRKELFPYFEAERMSMAGHEHATPPSSALGTGRGMRGRWRESDLLGLECIGVSPEGRKAGWSIEQMEVPEAQVSAHYGQGRYLGPLLFLAGVLGNVPQEHRTLMGFDDEPEAAERFATGRSHTDYRRGQMMAQAWHCWRQVSKMLKAEGMSLDDVAHITVFIDDPTQFGFYKEVERQFVRGSPARTAIVVEEVGHRDCLLEVEVIAYPKSQQRPIIDDRTREECGYLPHGDVAGMLAGPLLLGSGVSAMPTGEEAVGGPAVQLKGVHPNGFLACCQALTQLEELLDRVDWPISSVGQVRMHLTEGVDPHHAIAALGAKGWLEDPPLVSLVPSHDDILGVPDAVTAEITAVDPST